MYKYNNKIQIVLNVWFPDLEKKSWRQMEIMQVKMLMANIIVYFYSKIWSI